MPISTNHGLTAKFLRTLYTLEEPSGILRHKCRPPSMFADGVKWTSTQKADMWNGKNAGVVVGSPANGYMGTNIQMPDGRKLGVKVHNIITCMRTGEWPTEEVDHINRDKRDNSAGNHRLASRSQQSMNKKMDRRNSSGVTGVGCHKDGRCVAYINVGGTRIHLYYGDSFEAAVTARKQAERKYFGEYARMEKEKA